jgi:hypothetical protein
MQLVLMVVLAVVVELIVVAHIQGVLVALGLLVKGIMAVMV